MAKKGKIKIKSDRCKGCYLCVRACPAAVLQAGDTATSAGVYPVKIANEDKCIACGCCYAMCPDVCIEVYQCGAA